ncbi:thioesterase II family protein [Kitasatospora sp. NPDC089509]|uniref:thioesterase II family protein n=1 Tax=Kitasatospora sp. NPDC089509 TaxID=3364079 RepID=UPI003821322D
MTTTVTTWLKCPVPRPEATHRLVCFPHAGGSASFFHGWARHLPEYEIHAVCYPGRAARLDEAPATDLHRLAGDIADTLQSLPDERPMAFLGHSMGAVVAYETARRLQAAGRPVVHLYASGARAPHLAHPDGGSDTTDMDDEAIADALVSLGGTDAELLSDPDLRELVLPYVCGDFRMFDAYRHRPGPLLACPVTAIAGDADPQVGRAHAAAWAAVTEGSFHHHTVPGDHFYLIPRPPLAVLAQGLPHEVR